VGPARRVLGDQGHPSDLGGSLDAERIEAQYIIHLYDPHRVNQTRGITWFSAVMFELRMLGGYIEAELVAARTGAAKNGLLSNTTTPAHFKPKPPKTLSHGRTTRVDRNASSGMDFQEWSPSIRPAHSRIL